MVYLKHDIYSGDTPFWSGTLDMEHAVELDTRCLLLGHQALKETSPGDNDDNSNNNDLFL